ncbi:MAG: pyridoxamine 5'-phosphate oxidase family protein [Clostridia bacterium]|nr:pyridoxamine 5'-phosphate oxidase family protein [Clostridia bacterium]
MQRVYDFLKKAGVYYLATVDNGRPRIRPFGTVNIFEGRLYIQTGKRKAVAEQMKADPNIEICAMCEGTWIRLSAEAVLDERIEPQESMLEAYPALRGMYAPGDGNNEVYYLKNATAVFNTFGSEPETVTF